MNSTYLKPFQFYFLYFFFNFVDCCTPVNIVKHCAVHLMQVFRLLSFSTMEFYAPFPEFHYLQIFSFFSSSFFLSCFSSSCFPVQFLIEFANFNADFISITYFFSLVCLFIRLLAIFVFFF